MFKFDEKGFLYLLFICIGIVICVAFAPIVLIVWLCRVLQENNAAKLHEAAENKMLEYDMAAKEDFSKLTGELLKECLNNGYKIQSPITLEGDVRFKFYQSIDNVGIGIIRKIYGEEVKPNRGFVTNRKLTRQAQDYCNKALIAVIDRDVLIDMVMFKIKKDKKASKGK